MRKATFIFFTFVFLLFSASSWAGQPITDEPYVLPKEVTDEHRSQAVAAVLSLLRPIQIYLPFSFPVDTKLEDITYSKTNMGCSIVFGNINIVGASQRGKHRIGFTVDTTTWDVLYLTIPPNETNARIVADRLREFAVCEDVFSKLVGTTSKWNALKPKADNNWKPKGAWLQWVRSTPSGAIFYDSVFSCSTDGKGHLASLHITPRWKKPVETVKKTRQQAIEAAERARRLKRGGEIYKYLCFRISGVSLVAANPKGLRNFALVANDAVNGGTIDSVTSRDTRYYYLVEYKAYRDGIAQEEGYSWPEGSFDAIPVDAVTGEVLFVPRQLYNRCEQTKGEEKK